MVFRAVLLSAIVGFALPAAAAPPEVGSNNEAVIEPPVPHPNEDACVVTLVTKAKFGANAVGYSYTPPAACPGPWAVVVLKLNIILNPGRQFDRSGLLTMGGVPLWFGTTAEPRATIAPHWHTEKDVTDYTALFGTAQTGSLEIANYQSSVYTSTITANAELVFFPATAKFPAPVTADVVLPVPGGGGTVGLGSGTDQLAIMQTLPTNILHATLDLYLQGQSNDEFWYTCVPNSLAGQLESCGNGALREGEITVDGTPAGVAPVTPWIFTGGIDPYLWQPIPGVQTFNFIPFHADLSPFAGVLSNGAQHTIATSVYGADSYFAGTGALRLFLDKNAATVTGSVNYNNLAATPAVSTTQNITGSGADASGTVDTSDTRNFIISGQVIGSAGTMVNTLNQQTSFHNNQTFAITDTDYTQLIGQRTDTSIVSISSVGGHLTQHNESLSFPLRVAIRETVLPDGSLVQRTSIAQDYLDTTTALLDGMQQSTQSVMNTIQTADSLFLSSSFSITGHRGQNESASYLRTGTLFPCFGQKLTAVEGVLTAASTGC